MKQIQINQVRDLDELARQTYKLGQEVPSQKLYATVDLLIQTWDELCKLLQKHATEEQETVSVEDLDEAGVLSRVKAAVYAIDSARSRHVWEYQEDLPKRHEFFPSDYKVIGLSTLKNRFNDFLDHEHRYREAGAIVVRIKSLELENVGPASEMRFEPASRLSLLTGDNGLGKSFLLDVAWWALTSSWPQEVNGSMTSGLPAQPGNRKKYAFIRGVGHGRFRSQTGFPLEAEWKYSQKDDAWFSSSNPPWLPGLVVYAHADGSFSVWDPVRNYREDQGDTDIHERQPAYVFTDAEIWDGLRVHIGSRMIPVCNGLLYDWSAWIREKDDDNARIMASVLRALSPPGQGSDGAIEPGPLRRLSVKDSRSIPSINTSYAGPVPILHASSGIRRMCALAYMLVWTWSEHRLAAEMSGEEASPRIVMLFDEVESHLHPRWQRSILPSLLKIGDEFQKDIEFQLMVTTHSPLVLASAEAWFDPEQDAWFDLDLEGDPPQARLHRRSYTPRGTAGAWLTSEAFDLATDRGSVEAERAILRARELLRQPDPPLDAVMQVHEALRAVLPDVDRFWVRWNAFVERRGGAP